MSQENVEIVRRLFDAQGTPEFLELRAVADATISNVRFQGRGGESGVPFEDTIWQVARWRDGKAVWVKSYRDRAEALEAAGLSE